MPTTIVKTIGTGGDYSTPQAWEDAAPVDLVAADQIWQGHLLKQKFIGTVTVITFAGSTSDATRYKELTTAPGASFSDNPFVQTNLLACNKSTGAMLSSSQGYGTCVTINEPYVRLTGLQIEGTGNTTRTIYIGQQYATIRNCIIEGSGAPWLIQAESSNMTLYNTILCKRAFGGAIIVSQYNIAAYNCLFVAPSGQPKFDGPQIGYVTFGTFVNCGFFNANVVAQTVSANITYTNCYTDVASPPAGCTVTTFDTTTGSGFEGITDAARDFRIKSTSVLVNAGTTSSATTDIAGTARPVGGSYDVGPWEYIAPTGIQTIVRSIGSSGRDFSGPQAWEDALPSNIVTAGYCYAGEMYNDSEYVMASQLLFSGVTTNSTHTITLRCAVGHSFTDHANKSANVLRYNPSNGVAIYLTSPFSANSWEISTNYVFLEGIQFKSVGSSMIHMLTMLASTPGTVKNCLGYRGAGYANTYAIFYSNAPSGHFINCIAIDDSVQGSGFLAEGAGSMIACSAIRRTASASGGAFVGNYAVNLIRNCLAIGFGSFNRNGSFTASGSNYNASDLPGAGSDALSGPNCIKNLVLANVIESTGAGTAFDCRIKTGAVVIAAGIRDQSFTNDLDVVKRPRSLTAPTIGAWEYIAAGGATYIMTMSDTLTSSENWSGGQRFSTNMPESGVIAASQTGKTTFATTTTDSVPVTDALTGVKAVVNTLSDVVSIVSASTSAATMSGLVNETQTALETTVSYATRVASLSDTASVLDQPIVNGTSATSLADVATAADSQSMLAAFGVVHSDTGSVLDGQTINKASSATHSESGTAQDTQTGVTASTASTADTANVTDYQSASPITLVNTSDALSVTEYANGTSVLVASTSDVAPATDAQTSSSTKYASLTDATAATDAQTSSKSSTATLTDAGTVADAANASTAKTASTSDTVAVLDNQTGSALMTASNSDVVNVMDNSGPTSNVITSIAEAGTPTESTNAVRAASTVIAETLNASDLCAAIAAYTAMHQESGNATELVAPGGTLFVAIGETASPIDSQTGIGAFSASQIDSLVVSEAYSRIVMLTASWVDTAAVIDSASATMSTMLAQVEAANVSDDPAGGIVTLSAIVEIGNAVESMVGALGIVYPTTGLSLVRTLMIAAENRRIAMIAQNRNISIGGVNTTYKT